MSDSPLMDAVDEMMDDLRVGVTGIKQAPTDTPDAFGEYPQIVWYVDPGEWRPAQHRDAKARVVFQAQHVVLFVWKGQPPDDAAAQRVAATALDAMVQTLTSGFMRDKFNGRVLGLGALRGEGWGWYGGADSDRHFQAALSVEITVPYPVEGE